MSELSALAGSEGYGACDDSRACCGKRFVVRQESDEQAKNRSKAA